MVKNNQLHVLQIKMTKLRGVVNSAGLLLQLSR